MKPAPHQALETQIKSILQNPRLLDNAPHRVIYSELLNPEANKGLPPPTALKLAHEARVLFAAGSHTIGTTLMTGVYYLLRNSEAKERLVGEVRRAWPVLDEAPSYEKLEKLPFLVSVFVCLRLEFVLRMDGIDRCHKRDAAHRRANTCWPSCSATVWCRAIRR